MSEFETITLDSGQRYVYHLSDGETYENVLFDQRAAGAAATLIAKGTGWTIRNVGWLGPFGHHDRALGVADTGQGTSVIENVYMGDGVEGGIGERRHPMFGLWVDPDHNGTLNIRRMNVEGAHDNGFYASAPGGSATVNFTNCYAKDNWVAGFRLANGTVRNCVAVNSPSGRDGRPIWVWNGGEVDIVNCHFDAGGYPHSIDLGRPGGSTTVTIEDTQYNRGTHRRIYQHPDANVTLIDGGGNGSNPQDAVPTGCPQSADQAAEGAWDNGDGAPGEDDPEFTPPDDTEWNEPDEPDTDWPEVDAETITLERGEHHTVDIGEHDRLENLAFDCTADESAVTIVARGRRWRINNVAIIGEQDHPDATHTISAGVPRGSFATIENVYMGDGSAIESTSAIETHRHRGTLHVYDTHFGGWRKAIDTLDTEGRTRINRCLFDSNEISVELSTPGDEVVHSVFDIGHREIGVAVRDSSDPSELTIENCDFTYRATDDDDDWDLVHAIDGATATIISSRFTDGHEPDDTVFDVVDPDPAVPSTSPPTGVPAEPGDTFGRTSPWRRPARRLIRVANTMVRGAEEYGIRVGSQDPRVRTVVENCVVDVDGIGLIADSGNVTVRNCDIRGGEADRRTANGGEITSVNTRWGDDAVIETPDGVPLSAQEASFH